MRGAASCCANRGRNDAGGLSARDHDSLLRQGLKNLCGPGFSHARSEFTQSIGQLFLSQRGQLRERGIALK